MQDIIGQELEVGDPVAFIVPNYRQLTVGRIVKFTEQQIQVGFTVTGGWKPGKRLLRQRSDQIVKISGPDALVYLLKTE